MKKEKFFERQGRFRQKRFPAEDFRENRFPKKKISFQKKTQKKEKRLLKASYTVEASFLMSITFFVLAAFLICTFYLHDRAVMQAAVCEIASAGSNAAFEEDQRQVTAGLKKSLTQKRLMGSRNLSGQISTGEKVSASWSGNISQKTACRSGCPGAVRRSGPRI